jgi:hypothetical protein
VLSQRQFHIVLGCLETRCVNCEAQRFDSRVPAIVLKPELTFEKQARPDSEFHTVRLHGDHTKEILLRIVRQPLAEAKPESLPRVPQVYCSFAYSALASLRMEMSGSASFHSAKKSW